MSGLIAMSWLTGMGSSARDCGTLLTGTRIHGTDGRISEGNLGADDCSPALCLASRVPVLNCIGAGVPRPP